MKDPNGLFNTHILTCKGLISFDDNGFQFSKANVDLRCTSDARGETLSLTVGKFQVAVKVKYVEKIIKEARESRGDIG